MNPATVPAYLNGKFLPVEECCVSPLDRGFLFGDGIYEVIPVYGGNIFNAAMHFERMRTGLAQTGIAAPHTDTEWLHIFSRLINSSPGGDMAIYIQVTRGAAPRNHYTAAAMHPTAFAMTMPLQHADDDTLLNGVAAITAKDTRWHHCNIKTISLAANVLLRKKAVEADAHEVLLFRGEFLTEGAATNVFIVFGKSVTNARLATPAEDHRILAGITRQLVKRIAARHAVPLVERSIRKEELKAADEIWLTSSTKEILPVVSVDGQAIGSGKPGSVWAQFSRWLSALK